jgi:cell division septation protein DedD
MRNLLIPCILLAGGCTAPRIESSPVATGSAREEFDPQTLKDDDFLLRPSTELIRRPAGYTPIAQASQQGQTRGYRVQIGAVLAQSRAVALQKEARSQFRAPVYVFHDVQTRLYKIQIGNGESAKDVAHLRAEAKSLGYREAFIVRTRIEISADPVKRPTKVQGYRLQIFSASSQQAADQAQARARRALQRDDIYVEFEPPFFKVRIGNFSSRKSAESYMKTVIELGYDTPFPVETMILVSPE